MQHRIGQQRKASGQLGQNEDGRGPAEKLFGFARHAPEALPPTRSTGCWFCSAADTSSGGGGGLLRAGAPTRGRLLPPLYIGRPLTDAAGRVRVGVRWLFWSGGPPR